MNVDANGNAKRQAGPGERNCDECYWIQRFYVGRSWSKVCVIATQSSGFAVRASKRDYAGDCLCFMTR